MASHATTRDASVGPAARPVAIPPNLTQSKVAKPTGLVALPLHVRWSEPQRLYDFDSRQDRALAYEQILTEGTDSDVEKFIDVDLLVDLWTDLVLPTHVRDAWANWLEAHGLLTAPC